MTTHSSGTVLLLDFPNTHGAQGKPRPAIVVLDTGDDDIVVAPITSQARNAAHDLKINDWRACGLRLPSTVRIHKLSTMHKSKIRHVMGSLSPADHHAVGVILGTLFQNW